MSLLARMLLLGLLTAAASAQTQPSSTPGQAPSQTSPANAAPAQPSSSNPSQPSPAASKEERDPLLDPAPLPERRVTLIGGTIEKLDNVQDRLTMRVFGGSKMQLNFDTRTRFYLNSNPSAQRELKAGQRIYADTMLNDRKVFARSIWIESAPVIGDGRGQIVDFESGDGLLTVRDELSSQELKFHVTPATVIHDGSQKGSTADLRPGSLVTLSFGPPQGHYATLQEISFLAKPGSTFSFFGKITFLDLGSRSLAIDNRNDQKNYSISLDTIPQSIIRTLHQGMEVGISAVFDGSHYVARTIEPAAKEEQD